MNKSILKKAVALLFAAVLVVSLCACAFADNGADETAKETAWRYIEYISGGVCAFVLMRYVTRKIKGERQNKVDKDKKK